MLKKYQRPAERAAQLVPIITQKMSRNGEELGRCNMSMVVSAHNLLNFEIFKYNHFSINITTSTLLFLKLYIEYVY